MTFNSNINIILERALREYNYIISNKEYTIKNYIIDQNTNDYILFLDEIIILHEHFIALLKKSAHIPNLRKYEIDLDI
jgi:hypothetical protein